MLFLFFFFSTTYSCDCKEQLEMAMRYISEHGGLIIYLQQEGRGIGLANKIAAYSLQDLGYDTVDANLHLGFPDDLRVYDTVPLILQQIQLLTNNPRKVHELRRLGIVVDNTIPMVVPNSNEHNHKYLMTKRDRADHMHMEELDVAVSPASTTTSTTTTPLRGGETAPPIETEEANAKIDDDDESHHHHYAAAAGVVKRADGYCFGKQTVVDAIAAIGRGEMVVVVDDLDRENEGDFIMAADHCTAEKMAEIIRYSSGVICVAMEQDRLETLQLPSMVVNNQDPKGTAFAVSVDATKAHGISTGISATDRAITVRLLADSSATAADLARPGHLFPLQARAGGVLTRDGHTEATVDLARLAGCAPVGVLCEIVSQDHPTEMMRLPEMKRFAQERGYVLTSIADLIQYRKETGQ
jgi:3,4-dihydroxy 2-butanone 4-phosphate synthase / GTP cyclohydrolase II